MKLFHKAMDGGKESGVTGYWLIEWKSVFSIVLLRFGPNQRENFHSHAFHALTWFIKGRAIEFLADGQKKIWTPSFLPKWTPKSCTHKYTPLETTWAFSIRGPWEKTWTEYNPKTKQTIRLTKGRKILGVF